MSKIIAAHQPNFFPYLGFFDKLQKSDIFVIRDEVQFCKRDFHHRNKIRINGNDNENNPQSDWIGVPVIEKEDYLANISIKDGMRGKRHWKKELQHSLRTSYQNTEFFDKYFPELSDLIENTPGSVPLVKFNMDVINYLNNAFGINKEMVMASSLGLKPREFERTFTASLDLAQICEALGGDVYLSGDGGRNYLDLEPFQSRRIEVAFQDYTHPVYEQAFPGFAPYMSAVDALFCLGSLPNHTHEAAKHGSRTTNIR